MTVGKGFLVGLGWQTCSTSFLLLLQGQSKLYQLFTRKYQLKIRST